uniref:SAM-dependent MTase RsmB/NOP-type domain-containing protein n=1 Tax=Petromyzon marinus TaxID=7757 RepID=S4R5X4_PETMA
IGRTVCRAVLEHFDVEYGELFGQRWLKFRAVMLAPNKWQYAALPNLFAMQQRETREGLAEHFRYTFPAGSHGPEWPLRSLDDGRSAGVAGLWCFLAQAGRPFPKLRHEPGRLKAFYVLNAASLLPVLALGVRSGERVLDMCAAPGGKTLGILQCAQPSLLCANEPDEVRRRRLLLALESFVPRSALRSLVAVSARDGCELGALQPASYDKV